MTRSESEAAMEGMLKDARRYVIGSGEFLSLSDLAEFLRVDSQTLGRQLNVWMDQNEIFSIPGGAEGELFPKFAFDRSRDLKLLDAMPPILQIFGNKLSPFAIASWFVAECSYLDDQAPKDVLQEDPVWVIAAARDEMEEISQGC
jgi:hypothetical protein